MAVMVLVGMGAVARAQDMDPMPSVEPVAPELPYAEPELPTVEPVLPYAEPAGEVLEPVVEASPYEAPPYEEPPHDRCGYEPWSGRGDVRLHAGGLTPRLHHELAPDLYEVMAVASTRSSRDFELKVDASGELRAFVDRGLLRPEGGWSEVGASAGVVAGLWGWGHVAGRTQWQLPTSLDDVEGEQVQGAHHLDARVQLGHPESDDLVLVLEGGWSLRHAGDRRPSALPALIGPARYQDEEVRGAVWPGFGDEEAQMTTPIRYSFRQIRYDGGGTPLPVSVVEQHRVASGLGGMYSDRDLPMGYLELVGVAWTQTEFLGGTGAVACGGAGEACGLERALVTCASCAAPSRPRKVEQVDLNVMTLEDLVLLDQDVVGTVNMRLGASWLWDSARDREEAFAVFGFGVDLASEGVVGRLDLLRQGTVSADGGRFLSEFRAEAQMEVEPEDVPGGVSVSGAISLLGDPAQDQEDARLATRAGVVSEWYWKPTGWLRAGFYHSAQRETRPGPEAWDPWAEARWGHELGAFVRATEGW